MRERTRDSVRFDPYFKVQYYERYAWNDIQQRFYDQAEAVAAYPPGVRCRLMRIDEQGRAPVPESDTILQESESEL